MKLKLVVAIIVGVLIFSASYSDSFLTIAASNVLPESTTATSRSTYYNLGDRTFRVPANYQFSDKLLHSEQELSKVTNVESFSITALLPELEPITKANKHDFLSGGFGRKILVLVKNNKGVKSLSRYFLNLKKMKGIDIGNKHNAVSGLLNFTLTRSKNAKPGTWADLYVKTDYKNKPYFLAICQRATEKRISPSCFVRYELSPTILIEYRMHIKYIESWKNINKNINELVNKFDTN